MSRFTLRLLSLVALALALSLAHVERAAAGSSEGGRIYDPSRLRTQREPRPKGRKMSRPPIPEPEQRLPLRTTATVPNPDPISRGGSGYERKGKYFYETPKDMQMTRTKTGAGYKANVPRPEKLGTERRSKDASRN
jgi:hypothetical protein